MRWLLGSLLLLSVLWGADRLLLALESRGLLYYRRRRANPGTLSRAMMEVHAVLQPGATHVQKLHDVRVARGAEDDRDHTPAGEEVPPGGGSR